MVKLEEIDRLRVLCATLEVERTEAVLQLLRLQLLRVEADIEERYKVGDDEVDLRPPLEAVG